MRWTVRHESGDDDRKVPGHAYTVGLSAYGHAELVVYGLRPWHATRVLDELGAQIRSGLVLREGDQGFVEAINPHRVRLLGNAGRPRAGLQVVWADPNGTFPWEPRFRNPQWLQPLPDAEPALYEVA